MKKRITAFLLVLLLFLSACSIPLTNKTVVDNNFKGTRTITALVSEDSLKNFKGGKDAFLSFIKGESKEPLKLISIDETAEGISLVAEYSFENMDDYISKSQEILNFSKKNVDSSVTAEAAYVNEDSVFSKGIMYKDSIRSQDLLQYIVDDMEAQGLIENAGSLFNQAEYYVEIGGVKLVDGEQTSTVSKDTLEYTGPTEIKMVTYGADDGKWNRDFYVTFPKKDDGKPADAWMAEILKETGLTEDPVKRDEPTQVTRLFKASNLDEAKLSEITSKVTNCQVSTSITIGKGEDNEILFKANDKMTNFPYESNMRIQSVYYPGPLPEGSEPYYLENEDISMNTYLENGDNDLEKSFMATLEEIDVNTEIKDDGSLKRTLTVKKSNDLLGKMSGDAFEKLLKDNEIKYETNDQGFVVTYEGDKFDETNSKFFENNPAVEVKKVGMFKSLLEYNETMFSKMNTKKLSSEFSLPKSAKIKRSNLENNKMLGNEVYLNMEITNTTMMVLVIGGAILGLALAGFVIFKLVKKAQKNRPIEQNHNYEQENHEFAGSPDFAEEETHEEVSRAYEDKQNQVIEDQSFTGKPSYGQENQIPDQYNDEDDLI